MCQQDLQEYFYLYLGLPCSKMTQGFGAPHLEQRILPVPIVSELILSEAGPLTGEP